jgi:hypothetical protein
MVYEKNLKKPLTFLWGYGKIGAPHLPLPPTLVILNGQTQFVKHFI